MLRLWLVFIVISLMEASCIGAGWPHQNFMEIYDHQVGKTIDDPSSYIARYPQEIVGSRDLPNGNKEIEFLRSASECRVFFEVDPHTRKIVGWRYEGSDETCSIPP